MYIIPYVVLGPDFMRIGWEVVWKFHLFFITFPSITTLTLAFLAPHYNAPQLPCEFPKGRPPPIQSRGCGPRTFLRRRALHLLYTHLIRDALTAPTVYMFIYFPKDTLNNYREWLTHILNLLQAEKRWLNEGLSNEWVHKPSAMVTRERATRDLPSCFSFFAVHPYPDISPSLSC